MSKKVHTDIKSLSNSLKPEIKRHNDQITQGHVSDIKSQASMLLGDINALWKGYESSYTPKMYRRSGATRSGFYLSEPRVVEEGLETRVEIDLILDEGLMWHSSLWGGERAHSFMSISEGWYAPALETYMGRRVYRLTQFDGIGIIDSLVNSYNNDKVQFKFYYEGQEYA